MGQFTVGYGFGGPGGGGWGQGGSGAGGMDMSLINQFLQQSSTSGAAPQVEPLQGEFMKRLMASLDNPGMSKDAIESMINQGTEEISESESRAKRNLEQQAAAMGFGTSGARAAGQEKQLSDYSGQRANLARDVRLGAEQDRSNKQTQALGMAGNYLTAQQGRADKAQDRMMSLMQQSMQSAGAAGGMANSADPYAKYRSQMSTGPIRGSQAPKSTGIPTMMHSTFSSPDKQKFGH